MEGKGYLRIEWVDLFTTMDCNLTCGYCFFSKSSGNMSVENAKKYMDRIFDISTENMTVNFFGGEPLLNPDVITSVVEYCKSRGKKYKYVVCTNGTIFNEDLYKFFLDNKFSVQISIDGDEETHNRNRGSHDVVVENHRKMSLIGINASARLTYTPENVKDLARNIDYLHTIGFNRITHQGTQESKWGKEAIESYKEQADKLFELSRNNPGLRLTYIDRTSHQCSDDGLICKAGKGLIAVVPNGDVYPCHRFVNNKEFLLGNILESFSRGLFLDITRDSLKKCRACEAKNICHTCIASNKLVTGSLLEPSEDFCEIIKYEKLKGKKMENTTIEQKLANIENILLKLSTVVLDLSEIIQEKSEENKK